MTINSQDIQLLTGYIHHRGAVRILMKRLCRVRDWHRTHRREGGRDRVERSRWKLLWMYYSRGTRIKGPRVDPMVDSRHGGTPTFQVGPMQDMFFHLV